MEIINKKQNLVQLTDQGAQVPMVKSTMVSKIVKNLKQIKIPVARFFDSPAQVSSYYAEGEYDLLTIFKYLDYEAYFSKSVQKKIALLSKSGFSFHSNNDEIKKYINTRFRVMELQTGKSIDSIIKQIAKYLIICSNAFLVKVRDKNFEFAESYKLDGKEQHPVVGYFLAHPTTMKPRFKYVKDHDTGINKLELDKWVHINRRGILKSFELSDVCHFTLNKQDGLVFGCPEIIPVIDDIKVLRKMEEDCQLLFQRDILPIIHYTVEDPRILDHLGGLDELTQARNDIQNIMQDGGIATDKRHELKFVGSEGKGLDVIPLLGYFQQRVFSGLGMSPTDFGITDMANKNSADNASKQVIDYVKDVQQELGGQVKKMMIDELMLQSPYPVEVIFDPDNEVTLKFEEVDVEWKIRTENHEADLFAKGVNTIHETRNKMSKKDITDDELMYTFHGLYGGTEPPAPAMLQTEHGDRYVEKQGELAHATTVPTTTTTSGGGSPSKTTHVKPMKPFKTTTSAAKADPIKTSKTNSNIVKHKDELKLLDQFAIQDQLSNLYSTVKDKSDSQKKITLMLGTKILYDGIKTSMAESVKKGAEAAYSDLTLENKGIKIAHNIFEPLDKLRDSVVDMVVKDNKTINRASLRVATASRTETQRAYNYGYAKVLLDNGMNKFKITAELDELSDDSMEFVGKEVEFNSNTILEKIPPFRPNSKLRISAIKPEPMTDELIIQPTVDIVEECAKITTAIQASLDSSIGELAEKIVTKVETLNDNIAAVEDRIEAKCIELDEKSAEAVSKVVDLKDGILESVDKKLILGKDENAHNLEKVIGLLVDMQQDNKEQTNSLLKSVLKTISDAATKEIIINQPPMEVNFSLDKEQKTTSKKINVIRDAKGNMISAEVEEIE